MTRGCVKYSSDLCRTVAAVRTGVPGVTARYQAPESGCAVCAPCARQSEFRLLRAQTIAAYRVKTDGKKEVR